MKKQSRDLTENFRLVSRWIFPESSGGVAMHNHYLLTALQGQFQCNIISAGTEHSQKILKNDYIQHSRIPIKSISNISKFIRHSALKNGLRSYNDQKISKLYSKFLLDKPGLVEFMDIHSEGYHFLKKNPQRREKTVIRSHTPFSLLKQYYTCNELKGVDTWFSYRRERKCFNWVKNITTPSKDLKIQLIKTFGIKSSTIKVIPNILDTDHFTPINKKSKSSFNILHVGRFERAKGVETLVEAFIYLSKKYTNIYLTCIGYKRGSSFDTCKNSLIKNNLMQKVVFQGFVDYWDLPAHYGKSDLVIVPSEIYESFSYTVAQGMACGRPVVASNIGGIPETLNDGQCGTLFDTGNVKDLIEKIEFLYLNEILRKEMADKAREYAVNNYSINALSPKYIEYYKSIIA